jgi:hypothetical protein
LLLVEGLVCMGFLWARKDPWPGKALASVSSPCVTLERGRIAKWLALRRAGKGKEGGRSRGQ